jgi:K+-transporting ATPase ATPase A chain
MVVAVEQPIYRICGVSPEREMDWKGYAAALLIFSAAGMALLYLVQRLQGWLPLNPARVGAVPPSLALDTAVSYATNTNWQAYAGETTMSHFTQMVGLTSQNFLAAASGIAVFVALARGLARRGTDRIGNFWVDVIRTILFILLPAAVVAAVLLVWQGGVQTLAGAQHVEMAHAAGSTASAGSQTIAVGPAATQVISRDLGTSGGGFFNANSAHPFEDPTPLADVLLLWVQTVVAASLTYTYGRLVGDTRQGWALLAVMLVALIAFCWIGYRAEIAGNPALVRLGIDVQPTDAQSGGNMEGKETRFGIERTALVAVTTTATSTGAPNGMQDSLMPFGGFAALVMMQLGEVMLGGVGTGLAGMLIYVLIAAFVGGLMIGRTPSYVGKKLDVYDLKLVALIILVMPAAVLVCTAVALSAEAGRASIFNPGPHGLSEVLYAYTSMVNNNGSMFGGLNAGTDFYMLTGSAAMLMGRFWILIPTLALAGSLARKTRVHLSEGVLPTHTLVFTVWLLVVIFGIGLMTFLPALALGPIVEHLGLA